MSRDDGYSWSSGHKMMDIVVHLQCARMAIGVALGNGTASIAALGKRKLHIIVEYLSGTIITRAFSNLGNTEYPGDPWNGSSDLSKSGLFFLCGLSPVNI